MLSKINTVAFSGIDIIKVELQLQISSGLPSFNIVGLPDKTVAESKERIRAVFNSMNIKLPAKRITVNLVPADILKEGSHFDLPLALGLLCSMGVVDQKKLSTYIAMGELGLDGTLLAVNGVLPACVYAKKHKFGIICPKNQGKEAAFVGLESILAANNLLEIINHLNGTYKIQLPENIFAQEYVSSFLDMSEVKGQERAKRALEIAAAGGHNVIMVGPPGSGKSMLASRFPSILPPLTNNEVIETSMIHSVAGELKNGILSFERPFRSPHHSASTPSLVGGGRQAKPGEISLAHNGVLFLDEFPEFSRQTLEALRQPLETHCINISRVNAHTCFPAKFQLLAAMNPCRCGNLGSGGHECTRAPKCAEEYQGKISGPLLDRIDIQIEVPIVSPWDISSIKQGEKSTDIRQRVMAARQIQQERFASFGRADLLTNSELSGEMLDKACELEDDAKTLLLHYAEKNKLSARAYHRILRIGRTIADLQNEIKLRKIHLAEALSLRWKKPDYQN